LLSKISPEIVGESLEANRFYDAVNCLMSYMVSMFEFFLLHLSVVAPLNQFTTKLSMLNRKHSCSNIISGTEIEL
jgi:hypothetical protein